MGHGGHGPDGPSARLIRVRVHASAGQTGHRFGHFVQREQGRFQSAAALPCEILRGRSVHIPAAGKSRARPADATCPMGPPSAPNRSEEQAEAEEEDGSEEARRDGEENQDPSADVTKKAVRDFEYLVGMPISTLTAEKVAKLMQEHEVKARELKELQKKKPSDLWLEDLQALEVALDERDAAACDAEEKEKAKMEKAKAKNAKVSKGAGLCACGCPSCADVPPCRLTRKARPETQCFWTSRPSKVPRAAEH
ncbi:TOP2B [Symbiodinium sp. CCMP2456]|nr:TOP2B [Symbiodinium sp. CCMP2456]